MLDIGPGAVHRLAAQGFDPFQLEYIFLTHLHSDHSLDLVTFLQMNNFGAGLYALRPAVPDRPARHAGMVRGPDAALSGDQPRRTTALHLHELGEERFELNGMRISTALSGHTPNSLCYRFEAPEGSLVYTGDCVPGEGLERFCAGADLLVCECSFPDGWTTTDHMNARSTGELATRAQVRRLVATHLYPPAAAADLEDQIHRYYAGPVSIAQDEARFSLP